MNCQLVLDKGQEYLMVMGALLINMFGQNVISMKTKNHGNEGESQSYTIRK